MPWKTHQFLALKVKTHYGILKGRAKKNLKEKDKKILAFIPYFYSSIGELY